MVFEDDKPKYDEIVKDEYLEDAKNIIIQSLTDLSHDNIKNEINGDFDFPTPQPEEKEEPFNWDAINPDVKNRVKDIWDSLGESNYVDGSYPGPPIVNKLSDQLAAGGSDGVIGGEFKGSGGPTSSPYPAKYKDKVKNIETKQSPERKKALALLKKLNKQRLKQGKLKKFDDFEKVKENKIILENFGEDYSSWDDEELKQYYRRLEGRIDDYFGGEQKHVGDQGYQELMQDLENVEEVLEERGIYM